MNVAELSNSITDTKNLTKNYINSSIKRLIYSLIQRMKGIGEVNLLIHIMRGSFYDAMNEVDRKESFTDTDDSMEQIYSFTDTHNRRFVHRYKE